MPEIIAQKDVEARIIEKIYSAADGLTRLSGHASALEDLLNGVTDGTKRLRQGGGAASEDVTVAEQGSSGFYDVTFTPTVGAATGEVYLLDYEEPAGIGAMQRIVPYTVLAFTSIGVTPVGGTLFTSVSNLKEFLWAGATSPGSGTDALLANLIARATKEIQTDLARVGVLDTYTDIKDGLGPSVRVKERPIDSVTSVHESEEQTWDGTTVLDSSSYLVDKPSGIIRRKYGQAFTEAFQSVRVVYVGGWAEIPGDVEAVCLELCAMKYQARHGLTVASVSVGDGSVVHQREPSLTAAMRARLDPYRCEVD